MKIESKTRLFIASGIFILGLLFLFNYSSKTVLEPFVLSSCPDILIKQDKEYYLYNSKVPKIPGMNPIRFEHLEDYVHFIEWHKSKGNTCPVLYVQKTIDTQGNEVYKSHTSFDNIEAGLQTVVPKFKETQQKLVDANRDNTPNYNKNSYPGFDAMNQYIGVETPLDKMYHEKDKISDNPMDKNWGGVEYSQKQVDSGKYDMDEILVPKKS